MNRECPMCYNKTLSMPKVIMLGSKKYSYSRCSACIYEEQEEISDDTLIRLESNHEIYF